MKIAVVHNINQKGVINVLGRQNREMYYRDEIDAVIDALRKSGNVVEEFDGDKYLLERLETFFPPIQSGKKPEGLVFNLAYGIQGNSRYSHLPATLEMAGLPYTGSGLLTHSIALDKEITKLILLQSGLPTPKFTVVSQKIESTEMLLADLNYPLIIKPKDEAVSFGISVVENDQELIENLNKTIDEYQQSMIVEEFLDGREFNVGVLGNGDTIEVFEPVEVDFSNSTEKFQSFFGKKNGSYGHYCPSEITDDLRKKLKDLARESFACLKCLDYARVDFRLDRENNPYILELNSMAAIHRKGSYFMAAQHAGYDYSKMLHRIIDVALSRY